MGQFSWNNVGGLELGFEHVEGVYCGPEQCYSVIAGSVKQADVCKGEGAAITCLWGAAQVRSC